MSQPPGIPYGEHPIARFVLSDERLYRVLRHALLIGVVGFQFIGPYSEGRVELGFNWALAVNSGLFIVMLTLIYTNLYGLIPRLLWPGKLVAYAGAVLALIVVFWLFVVACILIAPRGQSTIDYPTAFSVINFLETILLPLVFIGATTGVQVFRRWIGDVRRLAELQTRHLREELSQLKSQINPHFLFNTLNNLEVLTRKDPEKASQILFALSDILRYQLYESNRELVILSRDIDTIRQLLTLESIRRDQFTFTISLGPSIGQQTVAPFLFMPFVENAIKHSATAMGSSFVYLSFVETNRQLVFQVENSKSAQPSTVLPGGIGLKNSQRRLELLYPNQHTLTLTNTDSRFSVKLELQL
ncbi:MAG: hypothetical protein EAZ91_01260 [Cytophagales bacterium]|nr:MAG: hypothetical protein EAZ91_01260 [Cytophagales bacterium]